MRKSAEYAAVGIEQYWVVDPELRAVDVFGNTGGGWAPLLRLDDEHPAGEVTVPGGVSITLELRAVLDEPSSDSG